MVKVEGNTELFGFFTCVNMYQNANKQCIQQIKEFVLSKAEGDKDKVTRVEQEREGEEVRGER